MIALIRPFSDIFNFDWLGSWGPPLWSALQTLGTVLLIIILTVFQVHFKCMFKCLFAATDHQTIPYGWNVRKRMKRMTNLKYVNLKSWSVNNTQRISKNWEIFRAVAWSGMWALNFYHISQAKSDQNRRIVKKDTNGPKGSHLCWALLHQAETYKFNIDSPSPRNRILNQAIWNGQVRISEVIWLTDPYHSLKEGDPVTNHQLFAGITSLPRLPL